MEAAWGIQSDFAFVSRFPRRVSRQHFLYPNFGGGDQFEKL
jgi:hypothetical protein